MTPSALVTAPLPLLTTEVKKTGAHPHPAERVPLPPVAAPVPVPLLLLVREHAGVDVLFVLVALDADARLAEAGDGRGLVRIGGLCL
jgi:hypothetical protein